MSLHVKLKMGCFEISIKKFCGWKLLQMKTLLVVFSNGAIKEEMMFQDSDGGKGSYGDG